MSCTHTDTYCTNTHAVPSISVTAPPLSYKGLVIVLQQWQCKCLSVTVPLLFKSAASLIHHWLLGTMPWMLTTISYLQDIYFFSSYCKASSGPCCIRPESNFEKCVTARYKHIYPDLFSLPQGVPHSFVLSCGPAETRTLGWVCISPVMKTNGLRETMFFPSLQLFTVPPCNPKYLHLSRINIKHHGRGGQPLLVTSLGCRSQERCWWRWWQMKGWEAALEKKKCTHASCLWACWFV